MTNMLLIRNKISNLNIWIKTSISASGWFPCQDRLCIEWPCEDPLRRFKPWSRFAKLKHPEKYAFVKERVVVSRQKSTLYPTSISITGLPIPLLFGGLGSSLWHNRPPPLRSLGHRRQPSAGPGSLCCVPGASLGFGNLNLTKFPSEALSGTGGRCRRPQRAR